MLMRMTACKLAADRNHGSLTLLMRIHADIPAQGKREANKLDKLVRIKGAAKDLFLIHGYDDTTTRQIAARADVALGTLFSYATNKRDLLFLVGNDLLDMARQGGEQVIRNDRSLIENFVGYCAFFYEALSRDPGLSKLILREQLFYDSGAQAVHAAENRKLLWKNIECMISIAHEAGEIELPVEAPVLSFVLFEILQGEIRRWIGSGSLDLVEGLANLWTSGALVVNGVSNTQPPLQSDKRKLRKFIKTVNNLTVG